MAITDTLREFFGFPTENSAPTTQELLDDAHDELDRTEYLIRALWRSRRYHQQKHHDQQEFKDKLIRRIETRMAPLFEEKNSVTPEEFARTYSAGKLEVLAGIALALRLGSPD